jgi:YrbI family 3-deoxy-D-manno-octulosonate 8-phosphate phosphatase
MVSGATKLRTGAILVADEVSLRHLGPTTALSVTWERVRSLTLIDECLVVTDSPTVRAAAEGLGIRCLGWQDMGPVARVQPEPHAARASAWPSGTVPSGSSKTPLVKGTELAAWRSSLRLGSADATTVWGGAPWDIAVFIDVAAPLWDTADLCAVVEACERRSRAFLAAQVSPVWTHSAEGSVSEAQVPVCSELSTIHGYRLARAVDLGVEPIIVEKYKAWSLRDPVERLGVEAVWARSRSRERLSRLPSHVACLVMDFDGVLTDNRVGVDQNGVESVWCHRGDGLGLELLRKAGIPLLVISKERNPVVKARCDKLQVPCLQGIEDKLASLQSWAAERGFPAAQIVYVGNDVNDLECMRWVGCAVAVRDSHQDVLDIAHITLEHDGGHGAVRELCELILLSQGTRMPVTAE